MATSRTFKPMVGDRLEDRTVPSLLGGFRGGGIGDVPTQDARQVSGEFETFERSFRKDFNTYVSSLRAGDSTAASTFNTSLGNDLNTLNGAVGNDIKNLNSANPNLASSVNTALTNLQTELTGLTLPTGTTRRDRNQFLNQAFGDIEQTEHQVASQVRSATPPAGSVSTSTFNQAISNINAAFRTFRQAYNSAIQNTKPSTDRTAFDNAVGTALNTLNSSLATAVNALPSSVQSTLTTQFSADILSGGGSSSLQSKLAGISTPSGGFFSMLRFRLRSSIVIGNAQDQVIHQITMAVHDYNMSLT